MALFTKTGTFAVPGTTGNQVVSGLGFTPKAIIFWTTGSDKSSGTISGGIYHMMGMVAGTANAFSICSSIQHSMTPTNTGRRTAAKAITFVHPDGTGNWSEADFASFNADGFTLNWTTSASLANTNINYFAIGGDDITGAKVVSWQTPASPGLKGVSGVGFKPDLVIHMGNNNTNALPYSEAHAGFNFGAMNSHGQQWSNSVSSVDAVTSTDSARWQNSDAADVTTLGDLNAFTQGQYWTMDTDGFTMNYQTSGSTRQRFSLCLQGVSSKIGSFSKPSGGTPSQTIDRVGFKPSAVLFTDTINVANASPNIWASWELSCYDGTNQRLSAFVDQDAVNPSNARSIHFSNRVLLGWGATNVTAEAQVTEMNSDGFSLLWSPNDNNKTESYYLAIGEKGVPTTPVKLNQYGATSNATWAFNQKKIARFSNGNIVTITKEHIGGATDPANNMDCNISTDNGKTWKYVKGFEYVDNASLFIDEDDFVHVVWIQGPAAGGRTPNELYYIRGVPNAGRTDWTWGNAHAVYPGTTGFSLPDLVAHRATVGTGWYVHIVCTYTNATPNNYTSYYRLPIAADGSIGARQGSIDLHTAYAGTIKTYPSIDFAHTGNGKTVKDGQPDLYVTWNQNVDATNRGLKAIRATANSGANTWGSWGAIIDLTTNYYWDHPDQSFHGVWDGTKFLIICTEVRGPDGNLHNIILERNPAWTTTTKYDPLTPAANRLVAGSGGIDSAGDVYFVGNTIDVPGVGWRKWTRGTNTWGAMNRIESNTNDRIFASVNRVPIENGVEFIYTSGNNNPYQVKYDRITTGFIGRLIRKIRGVNDLVADIWYGRGIR